MHPTVYELTAHFTMADRQRDAQLRRAVAAARRSRRRDGTSARWRVAAGHALIAGGVRLSGERRPAVTAAAGGGELPC